MAASHHGQHQMHDILLLQMRSAIVGRRYGTTIDEEDIRIRASQIISSKSSFKPRILLCKQSQKISHRGILRQIKRNAALTNDPAQWFAELDGDLKHGNSI